LNKPIAGSIKIEGNPPNDRDNNNGSQENHKSFGAPNPAESDRVKYVKLLLDGKAPQNHPLGRVIPRGPQNKKPVKKE
jgi:hypothetical protein